MRGSNTWVKKRWFKNHHTVAKLRGELRQHELFARTQRNLITSFVHNFNSRKKGENLIMADAVRPRSNTTSDHTNGSFASRHAPLGSFYGEYHVTVSVAIKAEREGEKGVRLAAKWSREMRIPSGWQTPGRLFEKVSFALIWLCWGGEVEGGRLFILFMIFLLSPLANLLHFTI